MSDGYIHWRISDQTERVDCSPFCWMCSETGSLCQIAEDGESFAIFLVFHSPPPLVFYKLFPPFLLPLFFLFFYFSIFFSLTSFIYFSCPCLAYVSRFGLGRKAFVFYLHNKGACCSREDDTIGRFQVPWGREERMSHLSPSLSPSFFRGLFTLFLFISPLLSSLSQLFFPRSTLLSCWPCLRNILRENLWVKSL